MACALLVRDHLGPLEFMKYAPDTHCVMTSYALLTLLKVRFVRAAVSLLLFYFYSPAYFV